MKITKASLVYTLLCNLPISAILTVTAQFVGHWAFYITWQDFLINYAIAYPIAVCIGLFIPLMAIGKWFTALFHVPNDTFRHNIGYRLLAVFSYSIIYSFILSPLAYFINRMIFAPDYPLVNYVLDCLKTIPFMILVGYHATLLFDIPAYQLAHYIDPNF